MLNYTVTEVQKILRAPPLVPGGLRPLVSAPGRSAAVGRLGSSRPSGGGGGGDPEAPSAPSTAGLESP
jgi:hypothetical protein